MTTFITRCPACQQAFRIDEKTLQAKDGQVRCGYCKGLYNAREHLWRTREFGTATLANLEREAQMERQGIASMKSLASQLAGFDAVDDSGLNRVSETPSHAPKRQEVIHAPLAQETEPTEPTLSFPRPETQPASQIALVAQSKSEDNDEYEEEEPESPRRTWLWVTIALVALVGIAAQLLAMYRPMVMEKMPQMERLYTPLCQHLTCAPMPQEKEAIVMQNPVQAAPSLAIEKQLLEKVADNRWAVRVTLKNLTDKAVQYPVLLVQLKSEKEDILSRRQVLPKDYLEKADATLAANTTTEVVFAFDMTEGVPAALTVTIDPVL